MPLPSLLCFVFAAGIAIALAGRSEIRVSPRPVLLTSSATALVLYASLLVVPVGVYFYVLHGDWFLLYLVDVERVPSAVALIGFALLVGVGVLGFAAAASLARAQRDAVSGALLVVALVATVGFALGLRERLSVVGTHAQFTRGFGLTDFTAGPLLPSAWLMGVLLLVGLLGTVARVIWGAEARVSSALRAGLVGFAVALSLAGCGPGLYLSAVRPATRALERAREAGAEERAPYDYYFAQAHLDKAREEAAESAFQDAADHARVAREYAERAEALCSETSAQP